MFNKNTVKHHITRFGKRDIRINRQRSVFKKLVKAFCPVNSAYINSPGLIHCQLIWIIALFVPRFVMLDCIYIWFQHCNNFLLKHVFLNLFVALELNHNSIYVITTRYAASLWFQSTCSFLLSFYCNILYIILL